jgi:hypothetical protein
MDWKLAALFLGVAVVSAAFGLAVAWLYKRPSGTYRASGKATAEGVEWSIEITDGVATIQRVEAPDVVAGEKMALARRVTHYAKVPLEVQS